MYANMNTNKSTNKRIVLPELSYKIMGALFAVHNELGSTMLEKHYQRAIEKELRNQNLSFQREAPVNLAYRGESIGKYFLDFVVEGQVIIESKAQKSYDPKFFKQVLAYLRQTNLPLAILVNFRRPRLEYKRVVNADFSHNDSRSIRGGFE